MLDHRLQHNIENWADVHLLCLRCRFDNFGLVYVNRLRKDDVAITISIKMFADIVIF